MQDVSPTLIIPKVVSQHAEDASFLWLVRDRAITGPLYSLKALATLDERVEAHLDGLRIAGEQGREICGEVLGLNDAGEVFACSVLALESGNNVRLDAVQEKRAAEPALAGGVVSALGWLQYREAEKHIQSLMAAEAPALRRIGIAAAAVHRQNPGRPLQDALNDPDLSLRSRALRAAGELGRTDLLSPLEWNLKSEDAECRFWAAWSCVLMRDRYALPVLRSFVSSKGRRAERAQTLAVRLMETESAETWAQEVVRKTEEPGVVRLGVIGAGAIGDPALVPWLIERMSIPQLARVAGEAFTMITGVDLAREHLDGEMPEGFESGPTDNPEDENVEMDPDDNLPWPAPDLIASWWRKHQSEFAMGTRYLLGKPIANDWLWQVLRIGRQRQRAAAALELALLNPGQPLFNVAAPGFRQQQMLR